MTRIKFGRDAFRECPRTHDGELEFCKSNIVKRPEADSKLNAVIVIIIVIVLTLMAILGLGCLAY